MNIDDLESDKNGYLVVEIDGKSLKVKSKKEEKTLYQLVGRKFNYIDVNFFEETVEYEKHQFIHVGDNIKELDERDNWINISYKELNERINNNQI